jgi:ankyrin repeat protein
VWCADCVGVLLQHKADVNAANADGVTPLHLCCLTAYQERAKPQKSESDDVFRQLLEAGADCTLWTAQGDNALHLLARSSKVNQLRLLFEHKQRSTIDVHSANRNDGGTALHKLVDGLNTRELSDPKELQQQRQSARSKWTKSKRRKRLEQEQETHKSEGFTPADDGDEVVSYVQTGERVDAAAVRATVELLLKHGLDIDAVDAQFGESALLKAIRYEPQPSVLLSLHC